MRIAMGSDHAGFLLKEDIKSFLVGEGHEVVDHGTDSEEPVDYPAFIAAPPMPSGTGNASGAS